MIFSNSIVNNIHDWVAKALDEKRSLTVKFVDTAEMEKLLVEVFPSTNTVLITREKI